MKKTSISSVVCFDIIDFAKKSKAEQQANKKRLDELVALAVIDIPENDRLIVNTNHGAIISCSGALESALEDALFVALTVRDEVLNTNADVEHPLYLLIGINLGSVKLEKSVNVNEPPKIIGEGLIEAQRIMSFANPNQILVSRAYYDMASKLTLEIAQMFEKYDMHAYEHDIYAVRLLNESSAALESNAIKEEGETSDVADNDKTSHNWQVYILPIILAIIMLFALTEWMNAENSGKESTQPTLTEPMPNMETPTLVEGETAIETEAEGETKAQDDSEAVSKESESQDKKSIKQDNAIKKQPAKKPVKAQPSKSSSQKINVQKSSSKPAPTEKEVDVDEPSKSNEEKSTWDKFTESVKQGADSECTQAQRALNQCN